MTQPLHADINARQNMGLSRILFGSDQMVWPEAIGMAVESVESADFLTGR